MPCINSEHDPIFTLGFFKDEYTSAAEGCVEDDFYSTAINSDYKKIANFEINQGELELDNGIANIFQQRFLRNDAEGYEARYLRTENTLYLY